MQRLSRRAALSGLGTVGVTGLAGCLGTGGGNGGGSSGGDGGSDDTGVEWDAAEDGWYDATLTNVLTDESFQIAAFDRPVLLEPFAVWCSNCQRQQEEMIEFHDAVGDSVVSVSIDIDSNEDAETVRNHAEKHGFDWRYVVSPSSVTEALTDQFGASMANPPTVPMVLVCADGRARRLEDGHKETSFLRSQVETC